LDFSIPPAPLDRQQRAIFWIVALVCALSRFLARARTLWDWDEALFCLGMRSYDVSQHHPHPPGFPVYIAMGRIVRAVIKDDFRSLQTINLIAAVLLFPAMFFLARELRMRFETATIAAALCAFLPNVWFYGGTAFSDVPSIVLVVASVAFLTKGCRERQAYLIGTFLLALSIGMRPQNLLVGLAPGMIATWYRFRANWRDVAVAAVLALSTCGAAFGGAAHATGGWSRYVSAIRAHADYIARFDSWRAPGRPPLWRIFDRFFIKQYQSPALSVVMSLFVLISVAGAIRKRDRRIGMIALAFTPFAISAWLMLDRYSINRFAIGYVPMFAILAADGIERASAQRRNVQIAIGATLIIAFAVFTWPALTVVRTTDAPTVAGVNAVRQHLDVAHDQLYVGFAMVPFIEYLAPDYPWTRVLEERAFPLSAPGNGKRPWLLSEIVWTRPGGYVFTRAHERLWHIARRHYFDVKLEPYDAMPQYRDGWYLPERDGHEETRWMGAHSTTILPGRTGDSSIRLFYDIPDELMAQHPTVTVKLNGTILLREQPSDAHPERELHAAPAPNNAPNVLELEIDRTINPSKLHVGDDPRDLGIRLRFFAWGQA
jgi:hypothetical protein